jgi:hypothetical protein
MTRTFYLLSLFCVSLVAFLSGLIVAHNIVTFAQETQKAPDDARILLYAHGTVTTGESPPTKPFDFVDYTDQRHNFSVVPKGKRFILTDMMYNARGVNENLTVNLVNEQLSPENLNRPYTGDILLQEYLKPSEMQETHLCTGFEIPAGHSVTAWTNGGLKPGHWVQITVTGYLIDERLP